MFQKITIATVLILITSCQNKNNTYTMQNLTDTNGFEYQQTTNDPTGTRMYTLKNGLTVYLSKNTEKPKIQTLISVRAGSVYDPADNTGLAHYLEHMLFKGTDKLGTTDWSKEKPLLAQISDLFEKHKATQGEKEKKAIYKEIDKLSRQASEISIANEYDKAISELGGEKTNAHTWHEETVYQNIIPSNELSKWLSLEKDRFSTLVLRLFHTELETVYEEYNRGQDSDFRRRHYAMLESLFPVHPYGQQTTIGTSEHLKNPSMKAIHTYFDTYYVPNNMAVILVGDIDYEKTIQEVNNTFGQLERKELKHPERPKEKPLEKNIVKEISGPTEESVNIGYRTAGIGSKDELYIALINQILINSTAGLMNLNLRQQQKVQNAVMYATFHNDYGYCILSGNPRKGQTLDEVKELLFEQVDLIKEGKFEDWYLEAIINDLRLRITKQYESITDVANELSSTFIHFQNWRDQLAVVEKLKKISKKELVDFANVFFNQKYVTVYKKQGKIESLVKVENPKITPVELNRDKTSAYLTDFNNIENSEIAPVYVNYQEAIKHKTTDEGVDVAYITNEINDLGEINIIFDMGKNHMKKLSVALSYLKYLGTEKYTAEQLKKEFFKIGMTYTISTSKDQSQIKISGLNDNLDQGMALINHLLNSVKVDKKAYDKYIETVVQERENTMKNKGELFWKGLFSYLKYGENSQVRDIYSIEELKNIDPQELTDIVKDLKNYKQRIFYYGKDVDNIVEIINKEYEVKDKFKDYPEEKIYKEIDITDDMYFVDYDMVQAQILLLSKGEKLDFVKRSAYAKMFNSYFGSGLSSIVFQEIRESQSLAYSAGAGYVQGAEVGNVDYTYAFLGTQVNKIVQATDAIKTLVSEDMPVNQPQFLSAKESVLKSIATDRITKTNIFWSYESLKKKGVTTDYRAQLYDQIKQMSFEDLQDFFRTRIKNGKYSMSVMGNKKDINLSKYGKVKVLDPEYLFNYK